MGNICNVEPLQAQGTVVVDSAQSISSENPLQNKVVTIEKANASALCVDLSGNPIIFNADAQAVQKLVVTLEPIQEGSGTPSPENVRPISGRTETGVVSEGKNLCPTGDISATSAIVGNLKAGTYTWSFKVVSSPKYSTSIFGLYDGNGQLITSIRGTNTQNVSLPFTLAEDTDNISLNVINYTAGSDGKYIVDVQIEHGDTATPYEPYKTPVSCSIQFGQTVYGGYADFKTGKVTILWKDVDMGSLSWAYNPSGNRFDSAINREYDSDRHKLILPNYTFYNGSPNDAPDKTYTCANNNQAIYIKDSSYNGDATALKSALNGVIGVYKLYTPIELQLAPAELELFRSYNYITAEGNMEISIVPEDVIGYTMGQIISAMGTDESGRTTASRAYTTGEYFYKDGKMYKALTSIASGATFTVGTNCSQTTIFAELKNAQN